MRFCLWVALALMIIGTGCSSIPHGKKPQGALDHAIRYTEITMDGDRIPISEVLDKKKQTHFQVPVGAEVDINSSIAIEISTDGIQVLEGRGMDISATQTAADTAKSLSTAIALLTKLAEANLQLAKAYEKLQDIPEEDRIGTKSYADLGFAKKEFSTLQLQFNALPIWKDQTFLASEVQAAKSRDPNYQKRGALLQKKLNEVEAVFRETNDKAKRNSAILQLNAFLETPKGAPARIHLEGYDSIDQKEARTKDPFVMDADDRKAFESQFNQIADLARQAERLRKGEMSLNDALMATGSANLKRLSELIEEFRPLVAVGPSLLEKSKKELQDFLNQAQTIATQRGSKEIQPAKESFSKLTQELAKTQQIVELVELAKEIDALQQEWARVSSTNLIALMGRTSSVLSKAEDSLGGEKVAELAQLAKLVDDTLISIGKRPAEIPNDVWKAIQDHLDSPETLATVKQVAKSLVAAKKFADEVLPRLRFVEVDPVDAGLRKPEGFDVPVGEAPNTLLELQRTSRVLGDDIFVNGRLSVGPKEYATTRASFVVREFGWHSVLAPSVILAKPTRSSAGTDNSFKFAPAVAWLHKRYPRGSDNEFWDEALRFFQPGFGLHAAFLDQASQKDTQVGLGFAVSIWHDVIVAGYGWNLMNNSRSYVYIGSNLIPILQALGFAKDGAAGKKR